MSAFLKYKLQILKSRQTEMPQEINMTNHVCIMYLMVRVECEAYSCIQKFGGNKFMTSENESKVSSDVSTAEMEYVKLPNTTVTDDKELKKTGSHINVNCQRK